MPGVGGTHLKDASDGEGETGGEGEQEELGVLHHEGHSGTHHQEANVPQEVYRIGVSKHLRRGRHMHTWRIAVQ